MKRKILIFICRVLKIPTLFMINKSQKELYKHNVARFYKSFFYRDRLLNEFNERLEKEPVFTNREKKRMRREFLFWWHFMGFEPEEYFLNNFYEEKLKNKLNYVSRWRMNVFQSSVNYGEDRKYLDDKRLFNERFKKLLGRDCLDASAANKQEVLSFFENHKVVFVKPVDGSSGSGIFIVEWQKESDERKTQLLNDCVGKEYLLEERIEQKGWLNEINPSSVNTIRMNTLLHPDGKVDLVNAFLRTGRSGQIVDNAHAGGILWHINALNGEITYGAHAWGKKILAHPDSKVTLAGQKIPRFSEAIEVVKQAALLVSSVKQAGWDVVISDDGIFLIEGNSGSGIWNMSSNTKPWTMFKKYLYKYNVKITDRF